MENDTLCVPDGGDTVYEVEGDGVGERGHGLWQEGFVCAERKQIILLWWRKKKKCGGGGGGMTWNFHPRRSPPPPPLTQLLIILQLLLHIPHQHIPEAMVSRLHARVPIFLTRSSEIAHLLVSLSHRQATIPVPCLPCVLKTSKIRTYEQ